jgi:hypothetical protein
MVRLEQQRRRSYGSYSMDCNKVLAVLVVMQ